MERVTFRPSVWWTYVADVFSIWPHGEECFKTFIQQINGMYPTINFTTKRLYRFVSFLDVKITLNEDGQLTMDLYTKPTDTHQYLHRQSCYLRHCKTTIAYSQALHLQTIRSLDEDYLQRVEELKLYLVNRGHGEMEIQRPINEANRISRDQALETCGNKTTDRILLVVTYHPDLPPQTKILCDHLPILHFSDRMNLALPSAPLVANRRPQNLKEPLTK